MLNGLRRLKYKIINAIVESVTQNSVAEVDDGIDTNEDFKKLVDENVNFRFRDIEEACRLNSTKALDKLEPQFKSPLFNDRNQKEILLMAAKTNREFATKLALYYSEFFSPASMDVFKTILAKKL